MQRFTAERYYWIGKYLAAIRKNLESEKRDDVIDADSVKAVQKGGEAYPLFATIRKSCDSIGLRISTKCADDLIKLAGTSGTTVGELLDVVRQLDKTIRWEMQDMLFMFVPPERANFYNQRELFSKAVNSKFPTIQFDLVEAGNCYACGRSTATVFHLMRIMEVAVQEFGKALGINLVSEKNWQNILDEINKKIKDWKKDDPRRVAMSQAAANLYAVKLAWRNEVMHPKDTYTIEEADNLIQQVRIFMQHLAKIVP